MRRSLRGTVWAMAALWVFSATGLAATAAPDIDTVMGLVKQRAETVAARVATVTYRADARTEIKHPDGKPERLVESVRLVTYTPLGGSDMRFLSMRVDGRALDKKDMEGELKRNPPEKSVSPFALAEMPHYKFTLLGSGDFQGVPVWEVAFAPDKPAEGKITGRAYIDQALHDPVWMAFAPSKQKSMVKSFAGAMTMKKVGDAWMPGSLHITLHVKMDFIFTWVNLLIDITETYSEHRVREVGQGGETGREGARDGMAEEDLKRAQALAWKKWGSPEGQKADDAGFEPYVQQVTRLEAGLEKEWFDDCKVFQVAVYNPVSRIAGPARHYYGLVLKHGEAHYLETDAAVLDFLCREGLTKVDDVKDVRRLVSAIAVLRSYQLVEKAPKSHGHGEAFGKEDWVVRGVKQDGGWEVTATFLVDAEIQAYARYRFRVGADGAVAVEIIKRSAAAGYS